MVKDTVVNTKRIAQNTFFLYIRTFIGLIVSLLTARVVFNALGIIDYGLNNVVGGVLGLITFVNNTLSASTSRFLAFEIGRGDKKQLSRIYTNAFFIHFIFACIVVLFGESIGLYMVNHVLVIPENRLFACNVLYQTVIFSTFIGLSQVQNGALIVAYEKMNIFAYLSVYDIVAKLLIVYIVPISPFDKLITLAILTFAVDLSVRIFNIYYCKKKFPDVFNWSLRYDKSTLKSMMGFSSWSLFGSIASMSRTVGLNFLLNIFFGPLANAANAIAYRVNSAIVQFTSNFTTAVNPQITKSYAAKEYESMKKMIFRSGKFTYYLLMLLCLPVIFEVKYILHLWLGGDVPEDAFIMTVLVLTISMTETFTFSMGCAIQATARIRNYQLAISGILLSIFPIAYIAFKLGAPPYSGLVVYLCISIIGLACRMFFLKSLLDISPWDYTNKVFRHTLQVSLVCSLVPLGITCLMESSLLRVFLVVIASEITSIAGIWFLGIDESERIFLKRVCAKVYNKVIGKKK